MNEVGRPRAFNVDTYCDVIEQMILADEVERALWMLDNFPGFYREPSNYPTRAKEIKESLHAALFTPADYAKADKECETHLPHELARIWPDRAQVLAMTLGALNAAGKAPHIMEIGPGSFFLPFALKERGYKFTYEAQALSQVPDICPGESEPNIFVAMELIEHLANPLEIYQSYLKFKKPAEYIFISTPLFTYGGGLPSWRGQALGHLRTYRPQELYDLVRKMFGEYAFECHLSDTITLKGKRV